MELSLLGHIIFEKNIDYNYIIILADPIATTSHFILILF